MKSKNTDLLNKSRDIDSRDESTLKKKNNFMKGISCISLISST